MTTAVIIQARMGSLRFPGKVLAPLCEKPISLRVLEGAVAAQVGPVVFAVPDRSADMPLVSYLRGLRVTVALGSPDDVLARFGVAAALIRGADAIVRLTADCPLLDPELVRHAVARYREGDCDYVGFGCAPDGSDVEVFSRELLMDAVAEATLPAHREHVTAWMRETEPGSCDIADPIRGVKYSVDDLTDLRTCEELIRVLGERPAWRDCVAHLRSKS